MCIHCERTPPIQFINTYLSFSVVRTFKFYLTALFTSSLFLPKTILQGRHDHCHLPLRRLISRGLRSQDTGSSVWTHTGFQQSFLTSETISTKLFKQMKNTTSATWVRYMEIQSIYMMISRSPQSKKDQLQSIHFIKKDNQPTLKGIFFFG